MTTEPADRALTVLLDDTRVIYDEIHRMRERAAALRTVEEARAAYEVLLAKEEHEIEALQRQCEAIALTQRLPPASRDARAAGSWPVQTPRREPDRVPPPFTEPVVHRPPSADRRTIKRLVTRYQHVWQLDQSIVAQVNTIIDNGERPLGEALSLLDWHVLARPIQNESPGDHERRVSSWRDALIEYRDWLAAEISTTETRYRAILGIWERWSAGQAGGDGAAQWTEFVEASRAARREKIQRLRDEIASMQRALEGPRS